MDDSDINVESEYCLIDVICKNNTRDEVQQFKDRCICTLKLMFNIIGISCVNCQFCLRIAFFFREIFFSLSL